MKASTKRAIVIIVAALVGGWAAFSAAMVGSVAWIGKIPNPFDPLSEKDIPIIPGFFTDSPLAYVVVCLAIVFGAFGLSLALRRKRRSEQGADAKPDNVTS